MTRLFKMRAPEATLMRRALQCYAKSLLADKVKQPDEKIKKELDQAIAQADALSNRLLKGD